MKLSTVKTDRIIKSLFEKFLEIIANDLRKARINIDATKYIESSAKFALLIFIIALMLLLIIVAEWLIAFFLALIIAVLIFLIKIFTPKIKKQEIAAKIEKELPFALMRAAVELNLGIAFEKIIKNIAKGNYGLLSEDFERAYRDIKENGSPVEIALEKLTERTDSQIFRRSIYQLIAAYQIGESKKSAEPLKRTAREIFIRQRTILRKFSSKLVLYSLIFVVIAAVVPLFLYGFMIVGSSFMEKPSIGGLEINTLTVILLLTVVFPIVDIAILLWIRAQTPYIAR